MIRHWVYLLSHEFFSRFCVEFVCLSPLTFSTCIFPLIVYFSLLMINYINYLSICFITLAHTWYASFMPCLMVIHCVKIMLTLNLFADIYHMLSDWLYNCLIMKLLSYIFGDDWVYLDDKTGGASTLSFISNLSHFPEWCQCLQAFFAWVFF